LGYRVPNVVKRTLTTLQITQFLVGSAYAAIHLFVSYTVPVSIAYNVAEKVAPKLNASSVSSAAASATSSVLEALPTATGVAVAFLRKLIYRAAGDEGLAENIAVPGQPLPYYQQQQQLAAGKPVEHPIEHFFHHPHETVNRVVYRTEYQSVPCLDTSGQAFAVYLNLIYLAPLTILFMRFFFKSYLRRTSPGAKHQTKHTAISKSARDATHGVEREIESLGKSAEDAVQLAVKKSRDAVRGRKTNANGKDDRHGSLSPANKKFVDEVKRKVSQKLQEIDETKDNVVNNVKQVANDVSEKAGQAAETVKEEAKEVKNEAEDESKPYIEAAKDKAANVKDDIKQEVNQASQKAEQEAQNANGSAKSEKTNGIADDQSQGWDSPSKKKNKSKLPQKKKERKETEESGVLVKREDAEEPTDAEVQKPESEPEPKDINNTIDEKEGKGLF
jgi:hypothetical protein